MENSWCSLHSCFSVMNSSVLFLGEMFHKLSSKLVLKYSTMFPWPLAFSMTPVNQMVCSRRQPAALSCASISPISSSARLKKVGQAHCVKCSWNHYVCFDYIWLIFLAVTYSFKRNLRLVFRQLRNSPQVKPVRKPAGDDGEQEFPLIYPESL